jgi:hypothetical protein
MAEQQQIVVPARQGFPVRRLSDSRSLPELALLIDAVPPEHRSPILQAALVGSSCGVSATSSLIRMYRSLFLDCLAERLDRTIETRELQEIDFSVPEEHLPTIVSAQDPAQTTLALCDLIQALADSLTTPGRFANTFQRGGDAG